MYSIKRYGSRLLLVFLALAMLCACAPKDAPPPTAAPAAAPTSAPAVAEATAVPTAVPPTEAPKAAEGSIIRVDFSDAENLNPILSSDDASNEISQMVFDALVELDPNDGTVLPDLAERWEISDDQLTFTYYLRQDVTFHDGTPLTAKDVAFTFKSILDEAINSPRRADYDGLLDAENIKVIDDYTISFTINKIDASWLCCKDTYGILPEHLLKDLTPEEFNTAAYNSAPVGSGPFVFQEWVKDDHITLTANPNYWGGAPKIGTFHFKVVENETVAFAQLQTDEADISDVTAALWEEAQKTQGLDCQAYPRFAFTFYAYNLDPTKTPLFLDVRTRQALLYALDRQALVDSVVFGLADVANSVVPPVSWAHNPDNEPVYGYDPEMAKKLLDEAGWKDSDNDGVREAHGVTGVDDGTVFSFELNTNSGNQEREQNIIAMQQFWAQVGVEATPVTVEWNALLDKLMKTYDFDVVLVGFNWDIDPDQSTMWHTASYGAGFNLNKYSNPPLDKIMDDALITTDVEERKALYFEMQRMLAEDVPSPILYFRQGTECWKSSIDGYQPSDINHWYNQQGWQVAK